MLAMRAYNLSDTSYLCYIVHLDNSNATYALESAFPWEERVSRTPILLISYILATILHVEFIS